MTYFYSPSTGGWYPDHIQYSNAPDDLFAVKEEQYFTWLNSPGSTVTLDKGMARILPPAVPSLDQLKSQKINQLRAAYISGQTRPVEFTTAAGKTAKFSSRDIDRQNLNYCLGQGEEKWTSNIWLDENNNPVFPFTFADLQGLLAALESAAAPDYQGLLAKINQVTQAETVDDVTNIAL